MTRFWKLFPLVALTLFPVGTISAAAILLQPGTPCPVGAAPAPCTASGTTNTSFSVNAEALNTNIAADPGVTPLNAFVVPGTVVLCEPVSPNGCLSSSRTTWSDVVQFFDLPNGAGSAAQMYADNEAGVVLPPGFTPSANAVSLTEIQAGFGDDRDFTSYTPSPGTTYMIHSDAAGNEIPDPETPEPSTLVLLGSGLAAAGLFHRRRRA
jgi:PEP-CTERM motif